MSTEFEREERYIVFKLSDVEEHFTPGERQQLARLAVVQRAGRSEAGKPLLRCVVVEKDWPEYEPTWKAIEARMTGAQPAPSVPEDVMRDARRYLWLRNAALDWYVGPEYATYNDVVCSGEYCNYAGGGVALDSAIDALLAATPEAKS